MQFLILYSTSGCHLCAQAQAVLQRTLGFSVAEVEIADDESLLAQYGVRIPVLRRTDTGAELGWPFGPEEVLAFLQ
jgi:hypothetical protein